MFHMHTPIVGEVSENFYNDTTQCNNLKVSTNQFHYNYMVSHAGMIKISVQR